MKPIEKVVDGDKPPSVAAQAPPFDLDKAAISCAVCLEILHNPVNISPCNHKFCGGCIFRWMDGNQSCPQCRNGVHDITKDGFAAKICEDYLKAYPGQCRSQVVKNELDQNELHYLQKLKDRMDRTASVAQAHMQNFGRDNIHREFRREHGIIGGGVRRLSRNPSHRGLHLTPCRYRDHQWAQRIKRLREQLHIPARAVTPPQHIEPAASRRIPGEHGGIIFGVMRALETPPHVRQLRAARFGTAGRRLVYPAGGTNRVPSPPRQNLSRDERRARRERRRQEAERQQAVHDPRAILQFFIGRLSAEHIDEDTSSRS